MIWRVLLTGSHLLTDYFAGLYLLPAFALHPFMCDSKSALSIPTSYTPTYTSQHSHAHCSCTLYVFFSQVFSYLIVPLPWCCLLFLSLPLSFSPKRLNLCTFCQEWVNTQKLTENQLWSVLTPDFGGVDIKWINTGLTLTPQLWSFGSFFFFLYRNKGARMGVKGVQVHTETVRTRSWVSTVTVIGQEEECSKPIQNCPWGSEV